MGLGRKKGEVGEGEREGAPLGEAEVGDLDREKTRSEVEGVWAWFLFPGVATRGVDRTGGFRGQLLSCYEGGL